MHTVSADGMFFLRLATHPGAPFLEVWASVAEVALGRLVEVAGAGAGRVTLSPLTDTVLALNAGPSEVPAGGPCLGSLDTGYLGHLGQSSCLGRGSTEGSAGRETSLG